MNVAYLCLGGNIGNRIAYLNNAIKEIEVLAGAVLARSNIYETEAWGVENQQSYYNQCLCINTHLEANVLLEVLLKIEQKLGRVRNDNLNYEPRTIDIDILFFNDKVINNQNLIVPHPRLHLRKFVLIPLNEIAKNYIHPILNKSIFSLLIECNDTSEVKYID